MNLSHLSAVVRRIIVLVTACVAVGCSDAPRSADEVRALPIIQDRLGAEGLAVLDGADAVTLFRLNPDPMDVIVTGADRVTESTYCGYAIVERIEIATESERNVIIDAVLCSLDVDPKKAPAACVFWPHHGVRVARGAEVIDFVICYTCGDMYIVRENGARKAACQLVVPEVLAAHDDARIP